MWKEKVKKRQVPPASKRNANKHFFFFFFNKQQDVTRDGRIFLRATDMFQGTLKKKKNTASIFTRCVYLLLWKEDVEVDVRRRKKKEGIEGRGGASKVAVRSSAEAEVIYGRVAATTLWEQTGSREKEERQRNEAFWLAEARPLTIKIAGQVHQAVMCPHGRVAASSPGCERWTDAVIFFLFYDFLFIYLLLNDPFVLSLAGHNSHRAIMLHNSTSLTCLLPPPSPSSSSTRLQSHRDGQKPARACTWAARYYDNPSDSEQYE